MLTVFVLERIDCKRNSLYIFHMKIRNCIPIEVYFYYLLVLNDFLTGISWNDIITIVGIWYLRPWLHKYVFKSLNFHFVAFSNRSTWDCVFKCLRFHDRLLRFRVKATFHSTIIDIPMRPVCEDQRHRRRFTR